ncbi:MAG: hypothetical protein LBM04_09675 [Opitutaceae bacterium]|nr:hypothetical protein [Opitutaceae bacterium]
MRKCKGGNGDEAGRDGQGKEMRGEMGKMAEEMAEEMEEEMVEEMTEGIRKFLPKNIEFCEKPPRCEGMRFSIVLCLLAFAATCTLFGTDVDSRKVAEEFIQRVSNNKWEEIAEKTSYPLRREYPLPDIKNKREFMARYGEIFDDAFRKKIVISDPAKDWDEVGWRGIMFSNGEMWFDTDGALRVINYQSKTERQKRAELIEAEKRGLHESVRVFAEPVLLLHTAKYRIRIDDAGGHAWRYAVWPLYKRMDEKPDLILHNGTLEFEGSGGNRSYKFKNGRFIYECYEYYIGSDETPPAELTVYENEKEILRQRAEVIRN